MEADTLDLEIKELASDCRLITRVGRLHPYSSILEKQRKKPPTKKQIKQTRDILNDLCIHIDVPNFKTFAELELWRKGRIADALYNRKELKHEKI